VPLDAPDIAVEIAALLVVDQSIVEGRSPNLGRQSGRDRSTDAMCKPVAEILGKDAGSGIGGRVHEHVVVTQVVREAVKDDGLIEHLVERCLDL
jgi:hypothetical protein